jgi:uncharacterized protein YqgV (UPF0045/DUF77 family)
MAKMYSNPENFKKLFVFFDVDTIKNTYQYSYRDLKAKFVILEDLVKQYKKKEKESAEEITKKRKQLKKDIVFELVVQLSEIDQRKERYKYLVFKIYFQEELPALLDRAKSVSEAAQKIFDSGDLSKLLGIMVNGVNEGRRQYVKKNGGEIPFVTGVPNFSVMTGLLKSGRISGLAMAIARKALSSSRSDIRRIADNMDILPQDLYSAVGIEIEAVNAEFKQLKESSKKDFILNFIRTRNKKDSQKELNELEKEVKKMNTVIKKIERKYGIVPTKLEGTLDQVLSFLKEWNGIVVKAKKELLQNKTKNTGETKVSETSKTIRKAMQQRRDSINGNN